MYECARGGHSHRRRVQSCDRGQDAVKRSRHFLGVGQTVKQCARHYLRHYWQSRGVADPFAHVQLIDGQGSRAKIRRGQAVKAIFRLSKILTPVAALDTAPMGVTPPWCVRVCVAMCESVYMYVCMCTYGMTCQVMFFAFYHCLQWRIQGGCSGCSSTPLSPQRHTIN